MIAVVVVVGIVGALLMSRRTGPATVTETAAGRVTALQTEVYISPDKTSDVIQEIHWDFGSTASNGIQVVVSQLTDASEVSVTSDAPDAFEVIPGANGSTIRIGDPSVTVTGPQLYFLGFGLDGVVQGEKVEWEAVGTGWHVPIDGLNADVIAAFELLDVSCTTGPASSATRCDRVDQVEPGHVEVSHGAIESGQALRIRARLGAPIPT